MPRKRASVGEMAPNARQEQRAPLAERKNEPIAIRLERSRELSSLSSLKWPRVGENRTVDANLREFRLPQRREARIGKGRLRRIGERILDQRPTRLD